MLMALIAGGLALVLSNRMATGKKILASVSTIGLFYALGTAHWFLNFVMAATIMYFYISTGKIEDVLLKIIVFVTIMCVLWWRYSKEGFYIRPLKHVSNSLTAKQCQDECERSAGCKYAQVPLSTSRSGISTNCKNSYGFNQTISGNKNQGGDTWTNKLWKEPVTVSDSYSGRISTNGNRPSRVNIGSIKYVNMVPTSISLSVNMKDQGTGNETWGVYIEGHGPSGKVFEQKLKAPRSSRTVYYDTYDWRRERSAGNCRPDARVRARRGNNRRMPWGRTKHQDYILWIGRCNSLFGGGSVARCVSGREWPAGSGARCEINYTNSWSKVRTGRRASLVQGPLRTVSDSWQINTNNKITNIRVYAKTRGSGHSLTADSVSWSVKGWPKDI